MIQVNQLKLKIPHTEEQLKKKIIKLLRIPETEFLSLRILKQSLDARKKPELFYVYTVEVEVKQEYKLRKKLRDKNILFREPIPEYVYTSTGTRELVHPPVIVGSGPAGLFCAYALAKQGYCPILLERGASVDERMKDVEDFWRNGNLKPNSNVQFGEGGAGTFSDGKLNTLIHDTLGRGREVLKVFVSYGAPERILYENKPHIGTDILVKVVRNMREDLIRMGADVRFHAQVTKVYTSSDEVRPPQQSLYALEVMDTITKEVEKIPAEAAVFAIGHSARDTFAMLKEQQVPMEAKSFAVGVRVEHSQRLINDSQYGKEAKTKLKAASYKLTANLENGRGVYTFCMCPGGYVVNASSEEGRLAVNGMSYSGRDGKNANSAVIVTVTPADYPGDDVLSGIAFQRQLEERAYEAGNGKIPVQLFEDFCQNRPSKRPGSIEPQMKGGYTWSNVRSIFPQEIADALAQGICLFDRKIPGYGGADTVISGVESRTSSPVRILRDEMFQSKVRGLYPCGEGAGYAGGITSAAIDGLKVAESISQIYTPFDSLGKC